MAEYTIDKIEYGGNVYKLQDTDEKLKVEAVSASEATSYFPIVSAFSATDAAVRQRDTTGFEYEVFSGTTSSQGAAGIRLGNKTASGTAGNKKGFITIYGTGTNCSTLYGPSGGSGNYNVWLPNNGGTIALTTDITDEKVSVGGITSGSTYYPIVGSGTAAATRQIDTTGFSYDATTSTTGYARITLGNSTAQPTSGSKYGALRLYGTTANSTTIVSGAPTAIRTITLPDKTGTVALTDDIPSNIVNTITTTAGTHTAITSQNGNVSFNVPTKTSHLTNDSGFITSAGVTSITTTAGAHTAITNATGAVSFNIPTTAAHVGAASSSHTHGNITNGGDITATAPTIASGDQIVINDNSASKITNGPTFDGSTTTTALTPKGTWESFAKSDTNTTYALSGALSSHKFTSTLTAGGSGSGTSTSDFTLAAGTGITITDDTSNRKMTIACSVTNTDKKLEIGAVTSATTYYPIVGANSTTAATRQFDTTGFKYYPKDGTTSTVGAAELTLGNSTASGTAGNKQGTLKIYGSTAYAHTIQGAPTAARTLTLPNNSGTIALTSDLSSYLKKPTGDNPFGWKLASTGTDTPVWDPPETYLIGVTEDSDNPGTYTLINSPEDIREAWNSGSAFILDLNMYNSSTAYFDTYRIINYTMQYQSEGYHVLSFNGNINYYDATTQCTTVETIICTIYLDASEQYYTDGEVSVQFNDNLAIDGNMLIPNAKAYRARNNSGVPRYLCGINASNQSIFGWGSYNEQEGASYYEGNEVYIQSATGGVHINPNISGFYKITTVSKTLSSGINANSYVAAANISMTAQSGFNAVGIVGSASSNFRIQPTTHYVLDNTHLFAGFANWTSNNVTSSTTVTFYVLWLKATSA